MGSTNRPNRSHPSHPDQELGRVGRVGQDIRYGRSTAPITTSSENNGRDQKVSTTDQPMNLTRLVYTVQEAADELRIGYSTARERIRRGELRSFKDGSRRLIAGEDLLAYVRSRREECVDGF